jgi:DNA-nicking Smr family endonuclease
MDFGDILDQWERGHSVATGFPHKDKLYGTERETPAERRRRLLRKKPDGTIDLHRLTQDEAWDALCRFFDSSREQGLEKLLVIHGKGNHPGRANSGALKTMVRDFIERCPFAGESGYSGSTSGGTGSTWVILKTDARGGAALSVPGK